MKEKLIACMQIANAHPCTSTYGEKKLAWGIFISIGFLFFIKFAVFAIYITPLWDSPDEPGHYSYVVDLSQGTYPTLGKAPIKRKVVDSWLGPDARQGQNWIAQHPPLFYALATPIEIGGSAAGLSLNDKVRAVRLLNSLIGALAIVGLMAFITISTQSMYLGLAGAIFVAATPMFTQLSGAVTNDTLVACTAAWGAFWYARWMKTNIYSHALICALIIGLGCITKITMLVAAIPIFFAMAYRMAGPGRSLPFINVLKQCTFLWIGMFALISLWILRNYITYGALLPTASILHAYPRDPNHVGFFHFMREFPIWQTILWNFIALIGWMGTIPGKVMTGAADGLLAQFYTTVILFCSFFLILHPLKNICRRNIEWIILFITFSATIWLSLAITKIPFTTITCIVLFVAVILQLVLNYKSLRKMEGGAWMLFTASIFILFFTFIYYQHIWESYKTLSHVKALHGRYFYPVLPFFVFLMLYPLRRGRLPIAALGISLMALIIADSFFLHYAFEMYGIY